MVFLKKKEILHMKNQKPLFQAFTKNSGITWLLIPKHLIGWFLISFSGEFVIDMAFSKKDKIFKLALEFLLLAAFHYCLALYTHTRHLFFVWFINWWAVLFIEAEAELISKLFYSNQ